MPIFVPAMMEIFDRKLLLGRRARAVRNGPGADYLLRRMAEDVAERLASVNRRFPLALQIGANAALGPALLASGSASKIDLLLSCDPAEGLARAQAPAFAADEENLPVAESCLDLVISTGLLQFTNDLPGALAQIRRTLKPDGLFLGALVGGESLMELRRAFLEAEAELEGGASPHVHPMVDVRDLAHLLQRAGLALPVTDIDRLSVRFDSPLDLLADLRSMGATNALVERRKSPMRRATFMRAMALYAERFSDPQGRVHATFEILHAAGWAPHASQQQPLKPGSATHRLTEVLGNRD